MGNTQGVKESRSPKPTKQRSVHIVSPPASRWARESSGESAVAVPVANEEPPSFMFSRGGSVTATVLVMGG